MNRKIKIIKKSKNAFSWKRSGERKILLLRYKTGNKILRKRKSKNIT